MGKSIKPKYRLIVDGNTLSWNGKASQKRLEKWIFKYADSLKIGGVNEHLSRSLGYVPFPNEARIETNEERPLVVANWKAGMFQVF